MSRFTNFSKFFFIAIPAAFIASLFYIDDLGRWVLNDIFSSTTDSIVLQFVAGGALLYIGGAIVLTVLVLGIMILIGVLATILGK